MPLLPKRGAPKDAPKGYTCRVDAMRASRFPHRAMRACRRPVRRILASGYFFGHCFRTEVFAGANGMGVSVPFHAHEIRSRHEPGRAPVRERLLRRRYAPFRVASLRFGLRKGRNVLTRGD